MLNLTEAKLLENNEDNFDRLMAVIEASLGMLALLIVSCEQRVFREEIIERYETELSPEISCYRVQLDQQEPSLRAALVALVEQKAGLDQAQMVVTVTGISELIDIRLEEKSPLERFFGYLQWTREGLRAFPFPIILWVTPAILKRMSLAAPDFWSWRTGVFRFVATETVEVTALDWQPAFENRDIETNQTLPIAELEKQISQIQAKNANFPALAILYDRLGQAYHERISSGNAENLQVDIDQAIASFQRAIELQRELNLKSDLGNTLIKFGHLHDDLNQYQKAERFYQQALEITREIGDQQGEANSLASLGNIYEALGEYQNAKTYYQQAVSKLDKESAINFVEKLLGKNYSDIQLIVFSGCWDKKSYHQISLETGYEYFYIKQVATYLWRTLSKILGESVSKHNLHDSLLRYYRKVNHNLMIKKWKTLSKQTAIKKK